jgi:hypothetical protein
VVDAFVDVNLVIVPDAAVRLVIVVVARAEVPVTVSVPFDVNDEVAVIDPPVTVPLVRFVKNAVTPLRSEAKRLVVVALVAVKLDVEALVAAKLVVVAFVVVELVAVSPVIVANVEKKLAIVPFVEKRLVEVALEVVSELTVVVARVEVPSTAKRPEVVALPLASTRKLRFSAQVTPFQ